jgi:hypothetical protein
MAKASQNRPFRFGERDRRELIVQDSETAVRSQNNANGNSIYYGRAKGGVQTSEDKWQIRFIQYDANEGITSITWPQNSEGNASTDYEFVWDDRAGYTYS